MIVSIPAKVITAVWYTTNRTFLETRYLAFFREAEKTRYGWEKTGFIIHLAQVYP